MKLSLSILPMLSVVLLLAGCAGNTDPDASIELASGQSDVVVLDSDGDNKAIRFTSSSDWYVEVPSEAVWLDVSPLEGTSGLSRIKVEAERNVSGEKRSVLVKICSGRVSVPVTVEQDAFAATFELSMTEKSVSAAGKQFKVKVKSDVDYEVGIEGDWLTQADAKGISVTEHVFVAAPNPSASERTAVISFSYGKTTRTVNVTQRPAGTEKDDWKYDDFVHRSLAMRFTADWCGYCPYMATAFESAKEQTDGAIELVSLHGGGSSLQFSSVNTLISRFGVEGFPTGNVDARANIPNYNSTATTASVAMAVAEETVIAYPAKTGIACSSSLEGSVLTADIDIYVKEPDTYRAVVILLEDGIVGYQNGGGNDYRHDHIARLAVTSINGERFTVDQDGGAVWSKTFTAEVASGWNKDNLRLLVYVEKPYGSQTVVQGVDHADYGDFGDTYVDNCRSMSVGTKAELELE